MKKLYSVILLCLFTITSFAKSSLPSETPTTSYNKHSSNDYERNWLMQAYTNAGKPVFSNIEAWRNTQKEEILKKISTLPDSIKSQLIKNGEKAEEYNWPTLPAMLYLDYKQTGTRVRYERLQGERRSKLSQLVIAEIIEDKGRFIPQIINGLWLLMEESTWVAPAHIVVQKEGADLANIENPYIDLNASRTAVMVANIQNLLAPKLARYSKVINPRIVNELNRRIFEPYLKGNFWWMGLNNQSVNNWNTFVNTNCLQAALLTMPSGDPLEKLVQKILFSTDKFINQYPEDGGCDEGPSYWDMAGGQLIRLLSTVKSASNGNIDLSDKELIHRIGTYTYKMQIADSYVVNFADAHAKYSQSPESVYLYGQMFQDEHLKSFAAFLLKENRSKLPSDITNFLGMVSVYDKLLKVKPEAPYPAVSVLKDLQVVTARSKAGSTEGLFLAVKGGNNAESHNHNDIGSFIVYADGKPVLIDAGVGTYTSKTFSSKRYELWNVQSQWHNSPIINGVQQAPGKKYKAKQFKVETKGKSVFVQMDLAQSYPEQAAVKNWVQSLTFIPTKNGIHLDGDYALSAWKAPQELNFITPLKVRLAKGLIYFESSDVVLRYNPAIFEADVEEKEMDDNRIIGMWGEKLYRIHLKMKSKVLKGKYSIQILQK